MCCYSYFQFSQLLSSSYGQIFFTNSYIVLCIERLWPVQVTISRGEKIFSVLILLQFKRTMQNYVLNQQKPAYYYSLHTRLPTHTCAHTQTHSLSSVTGGYLRCISPHLPTQILVRISARIPLPIIPLGSLLMCICLIEKYYLYRSLLPRGVQIES